MNKFDNVDALLKELGISRATAYRRARKYDISLSDLSSGLSDDEIEKLKKPLQNSGKQRVRKTLKSIVSKSRRCLILSLVSRLRFRLKKNDTIWNGNETMSVRLFCLIS